jgi:hypothetical protein
MFSESDLTGLSFNIAFQKLITTVLSYSKVKVTLNKTQEDIVKLTLAAIQQMSIRFARKMLMNQYVVFSKKLLIVKSLLEILANAKPILEGFKNSVNGNAIEEVSIKVITILSNFTTLLTSFGKFNFTSLKRNLTSLKGQSHKKVGEMRVRGICLGPN